MVSDDNSHDCCAKNPSNSAYGNAVFNGESVSNLTMKALFKRNNTKRRDCKSIFPFYTKYDFVVKMLPTWFEPSLGNLRAKKFKDVGVNRYSCTQNGILVVKMLPARFEPSLFAVAIPALPKKRRFGVLPGRSSSFSTNATYY